MKKLIIILLIAIPIVASSIEFKTLPLVYPQGGGIPREFAPLGEGVVGYFSNNDTLQYYNGSEWESFTDYSRKKYGQPGKMVNYQDELFILDYPRFKEIGKIIKINKNGDIVEIVPPWEDLDDISPYGYTRSLRDIDVDKNGNLYTLTRLRVVTEPGPTGQTEKSAGINELIITNSDGELVNYFREKLEQIPAYNTKDTLPSINFDFVKVANNGTIYMTGLEFSDAPTFWKLESDNWESIDIGYNSTYGKPF